MPPAGGGGGAPAAGRRAARTPGAGRRPPGTPPRRCRASVAMAATRRHETHNATRRGQSRRDRASPTSALVTTRRAIGGTGDRTRPSNGLLAGDVPRTTADAGIAHSAPGPGRFLHDTPSACPDNVVLATFSSPATPPTAAVPPSPTGSFALCRSFPFAVDYPLRRCPALDAAPRSPPFAEGGR